MFKGINEQKHKLTPKSTTDSSELRNIYPVRFITPRIDPIQNIKIKPKMKVSDLPDYNFGHTPLSPQTRKFYTYSRVSDQNSHKSSDV